MERSFAISGKPYNGLRKVLGYLEGEGDMATPLEKLPRKENFPETQGTKQLLL